LWQQFIVGLTIYQKQGAIVAVTERRYFVTDEQEEAKNWRMLKHRKQIRERLARLEDEMKQFAASWTVLGRTGSDPSGRSFKFDEEEIFVVNDRGQPIGRLPWRHFERAKIEDLLADLQNSNEELESTHKSLKALGVD
jgi:hypothetical protein